MEKRIQKLIDAAIQRPEEFYKQVSEEKGFRPAIIHYLLCMLAATPIVLVISYLSVGLASLTPLPWHANLAGALAATALNVVLGLAGACIYVGIFHAVSYLLGAREGVLRTAQIYSYGMTASLVISPYINGISGYFGLVYNETLLGVAFFIAWLSVAIWSFYRIYKGVRILQKLAFWRAVLAVILPFFILFALYAVIYVLSMPVA